MGFFNRIQKGQLFFGKKVPGTVVDFFFEGKHYTLEEFDLEFYQDVGQNHRPDGLPYGGIITLTISETPGDSIYKWMIQPQEKRNGVFRFLGNEGKIDEGDHLQIAFWDAYCISYQKIINPRGSGLLTTLIISPHRIRVGNEEFQNQWK